MIDYYEILRLAPGAGEETIEESYQVLLETMHPGEASGGKPDEHFAQAKKEIRLLNEAYEVLHDPGSRREYDRERNLAIEAAKRSLEPLAEELPALVLTSGRSDLSVTSSRSAEASCQRRGDRTNAGLIAAFLLGVLIASGVLAVKYRHTGSEMSFVTRLLSQAKHTEGVGTPTIKLTSGDPSMAQAPSARQAHTLNSRIADRGVVHFKSEQRRQDSDATGGQTGAARRERPVSVDIILAKGQQTFGAQQIGNIEVVYPDGLQDAWTTKGNCGQAHVAANGTVGWTVYQATRSGNYDFQPNGTLVLRRGGQIIQTINVPSGQIDGWNFLDSGGKIVLRARGSSGGTLLERYESATGRLLESVDAGRSDLPSWALSVADR